jgi:nitrite reductase/ring-hydroxylating ferredoxin subunit
MTRREALFRFFRYLVSGGLLYIGWSYVRPTGSPLLKVSFSGLPDTRDVIFKDGVYLVGLDQGPIALAATCPHLGCQLDFVRGLNHFRCPCHGSAFDLAGKRIKGPAAKDMTGLELNCKGQGEECCVTLVLS